VAIAQYEDDAPRAYLFLVSEDFQVIVDKYWDSVEEAAHSGFDGEIIPPWATKA
jgi:hypothetical protein